MSTTLETVTPVAVGTNPTLNNISYSATDWLEVKNDSPFGITVQIIGVSANSFFLSPFEHNAWPIAQLLQTSQLQIKNLSIIITPSHYYTEVATENNSPTNICTINQLSQQEAQTNTYPLYTARMNTTVSTLANILQNVGSIPGTPIGYAQANGDTNVQGAWSLTNTGLMTLGDNAYNGQMSVFDTTGDESQLSGSGLFMSNGALTGDVPSLTVNGNVSGNVTVYMIGQMLGFKVFVVVFSNYNNSGYTTINLPVSISWGFFACGNIGSSNRLQLLNNGSAQNVSIITALGTGAVSGSSSGSSSIYGNSIGQLPGNLVNQFGINNVVTAITEVFVMIGG